MKTAAHKGLLCHQCPVLQRRSVDDPAQRVHEDVIVVQVVEVPLSSSRYRSMCLADNLWNEPRMLRRTLLSLPWEAARLQFEPELRGSFN